MSWVSIYVHMVFCTKNREPFLQPEIRKQVFQHIKENGEEKNIWIDSVNGHEEHAHCLISLNRQHSISKVAQLIKGESSHWINQHQLTNEIFAWQDDYWAVSVSPGHLQQTRAYILNQEARHQNTSFKEEIERF